ncbi:MAG: lipid-A-disaccharide synthase, partial [Bacillota bacterium]
LIAQQYDEPQFLLPVAETIAQDEIAAKVEQYQLDINLIPAHSYEVMENSDLLLSTSGTATLEASFFRTPMVIIYKTSWLSYALSKVLVEIPYVGLPNIIAEEEIVPELLQSEANGQEIANQALQILASSQRQERIKNKLELVENRLGAGGAVKRVAQLVLNTGGIAYEIS